MSGRDILGLVLSYLFAFGFIGFAEAVRVWRGWPTEFTRKVIHIAAGSWVIGIIYIFDHWWWGVVPTASFVILNYIFYRFTIFKAMDTRGSTPGTVYFALSITILLLLLWPRGQEGMVAAGVMPMTWGDAFASLIGLRWGRHRYEVLGSHRSWEGSAAMFVFSLLATFLVLLVGLPLSPGEAFLYSFIMALGATLVEAFSPWGLDNLSVPFFSTGLLYLLLAA
ncbi:MAG: phosphatidate cytidylyltransferase [Anaerolineae bacterium]